MRSVPHGVTVEAVEEIGAAFAVRAQSAWLGWPADLKGRLLAASRRTTRPPRSDGRVSTALVAEEFDNIIGSVLTQRR